MKNKTFLLLGAALMSMLACNKNNSAPEVPSGKSAVLTITLKKGNVSTKGTENGTDNENKINTLDVFVFNSTGDLDAFDRFVGYDATSESTKPVINCTTGAGKIVYVLVNGQWTRDYLAANIGNADALKALVFELDKNRGESALDNFEMIGHNSKDFTPGANTISVTVSRVVARVRLKKITRNFSSSALNGKLEVVDVYMSNVVGSYGLGGDDPVMDAADNIWWNKYAYEADHEPYPGYISIDAAMNQWLHKTPATPQEIASNASIDNLDYVFYVMPNQVAYNAADGGTEWAPRRTKLVVEVRYTPVGGTAKTYYYPIPICEQETYPELAAEKADTYNGLNANTSYDITELELTRLGSTNPDEPVVAADVTLTIEVAPWDIYPLETESGKYVI